MKENYFKSIMMIERIYRLFLYIMNVELNRMDIHDITSVQCLILYNIGKSKITINEITNLGYYLGQNVSYNKNQMIKNGYIINEQNEFDLRSNYIYLSKKGLNLYKSLDILFTSHFDSLKCDLDDPIRLAELIDTLSDMEKFLNHRKN